MRKGLAVAALAAACALQICGGIPFAGRAQAQDTAANYPSFPIRIVVPYPAGSIPDTLGRLIGEQLQTQLGKPVVVENRAGASTLLGAKVVANAEPDGYTLLIPTVTTLSIAPQLNPKTGVNPINDFTPIARLGATNFFLVVRSSFPAKTMREWIDEVKRNPGKYRYASAGIGTPHHIFMELLKQQLGLDITHVPYKGSVEAVPDLLAGRVDMAFLDGSQAVSHIKSGELQALGTSMARQTDLIEGVPPIAATVPGFDWSGWIMIAGPHGMPKAVVARIAAQVADVEATPRFTEALRNALMETMSPLSPDQTAAFVRDEYQRWKPVIKLSGAVE
ncbi:MAG TPA: tripartite tricarboxylate transporter substrate binding protein [Bradyrhizobium sp.]|jgi:tripartite-type tricarboxylate transporter receptor subunit TctC|uniref:Bug family tripartite tricarboxylate transporter substrate binding protein n=1 Tax=Bradyrhizobium sp. TaxID=376 RepID=UPI002CEF2316|nr:tripartite tricarboxylate transporter substrate binding protein [Bradyrhizobium sp.]HTB03559.1 tripartite tricarboxylate transporter substrate binding protein [Bradyrhizobium sp.]